MNKIRTFLIWFTSLVFLLGTLEISPAEAALNFHSSLTNLATLRQMVQNSVPYKKAINNGKPSLIEFYADWCQTCQSLAPMLQIRKQEYGKSVNFVMLNIDDPKWKKQVKKYQITGVPKLIFLNGDREILKTFVGRVPGVIIDDILSDMVSQSVLDVGF